MITITMPDGPKKIELRDAAYILSFHTMVASLKKFVLKDVHLDTKKNCLTYLDQTFCILKKHYRQWTLEFHEPQSAFLAYPVQTRAMPDI